MKTQSIVLPQRLKIIEVEEIGFGSDIEKGSVDAIWETKVRWCDEDVDAHVAKLSEELCHTAVIPIHTHSKNDITENSIYEAMTIPGLIGRVFCKIEKVA